MRRPRLTPLALLELRRSLAPALLVALLVLAALLLACDRGASLTGLQPDRELVRGQARLLLWLASLLILVPASIGRAAAAGCAHARRESPWLAPRAATPGPVALATWVGQLSALALLLSCIWLAGELGAGRAVVSGSAGGSAPSPSGPALEERGPATAVPRMLLSPGAHASWTLRDVAHRDRLHLPAVLAAGGDSAENRAGLVLGARRRAAGIERPATLTPWTEAGTLTWMAPAGDGTLEITLRNEGPATLIVGGPGGLSHWRPTPTDSRGPRTLLLLWLLALAPALALAQGLGFWMSPACATGVVLCLGLAIATSTCGVGPTPFWIPWPGADLSRAMSVLGTGRSPAPPGASALAIACFWSLPGLLLARGRRS